MSLLDAIKRRAATKSMYDIHPELLGRIPIGSFSSEGEAFADLPGGWSLDVGRYVRNVWVRKAINILSENIKRLTMLVWEGEEGERAPIKSDLNDILANPNEAQDSATFWGEWVVDMMLGGEHGVELVFGNRGGLLEMYPRQPPDFLVRKGKGGRRYRRVSEYFIDDGEDDPYTLQPEEFIHWKFYNPLNVWRGLSPISAVRMGIQIDELAQAWSRLFFKNSARPDYAVITPEGTTKTEKDELETKLANDFGKATNAHRPIVLEEGVQDIKVFSFPPKDLEWLEQRKLSRDEVGGIFGVPDEIMGYGRDTYENFDTADRVLWTITLVSLILFRDKGITHKFRQNGLLKPGQFILTDLRRVPQLQEDRTKVVDQFATLVDSFVPPNMASEYLGMGLSDIPGGDQPVTTVRPIQLNMPRSRTLAPRNKAASPEFGTAEHEALWKQAQDILDEPVDALQRKLKKYFQDQQNRISAALRDSEQRTYGRGKFVGKQIPPPSDLFDIDAEIERFINDFGMDEEIAEAFALVAAAAIASLGFDFVVDMTDPFMQAAIADILNAVAKAVNDTTFAGLIDLFLEAEAAGESIPAIQERLSAFFGDRKSDWQTERIARTTMTASSGQANILAWEQLEAEEGISIVMTWISALLPDRTRETHAEAHGQVRPRGQSFSVGGELLRFPGDPAGSAGNVINCLCTLDGQVA